MGHYAVHAQRQARRREERAFMAPARLRCSGLGPAGPRSRRKRILGSSGPACSAVERERRPNGRRRTLEARPFWAKGRTLRPGVLRYLETLVKRPTLGHVRM